MKTDKPEPAGESIAELIAQGYLAPMTVPTRSLIEDIFGPVVYSFTRKQLLADGLQVEVPEKPRFDAGFKIPMFMSRLAWDTLVVVPEGLEEAGQSETGRLMDVLLMARLAAGQTTGSTVIFQVHVLTAKRRRSFVVKGECGPTDVDDPAPCILLSLLSEY